MTPATAIADKVRSALARELKRDPATIAPEHALRDDLGLNSLDAIELMFKVEDEFDIEIPDADLQRLRTVGDLVSYLEERLQGTSRPPEPPSPIAAPAALPPKTAAGTPPAGPKRSGDVPPSRPKAAAGTAPARAKAAAGTAPARAKAVAGTSPARAKAVAGTAPKGARNAAAGAAAKTTRTASAGPARPAAKRRGGRAPAGTKRSRS